MKWFREITRSVILIFFLLLFWAGDDGFEPMVVTEMPKATFSKPKVRNYSCRGQKLLKPSFSNRRASQRQQNGNSQGKLGIYYAQNSDFEESYG